MVKNGRRDGMHLDQLNTKRMDNIHLSTPLNDNMHPFFPFNVYLTIPFSMHLFFPVMDTKRMNKSIGLDIYLLFYVFHFHSLDN